MGIRIQPKEIEVPEDNPFKHDLLGREKPVEILTHLIGSVEGPCVLAIDAAWGTGKTTFIRMWSQYLRNKNFPVIEFNAWENDFAGDPFVALSAELTDGFREYVDESLAEKMQNVASEVLQWIVPGAIRGITASTPLGGLGEIFASYAEERLAKYQATKDSVKAFKKSLKEIACELMKPRDGQPGRPLVVIIDELDRCRPSYAVELLEVAKHLFAVDNIIFVLAVNRSQLARSIKALYGSDFDAEGYLRRFFDLDFQLPDPDRKAFINALLDATQIKQYLSTRDMTESAHKLLAVFFDVPSLSLRRVAQAIHRLSLVFASVPSDQQSDFALMAVVALIMRTFDFDQYHKFVNGELSDEEMVNIVFNWPGAETLRQESQGERMSREEREHRHLRGRLEATIIAAYIELKNIYNIDKMANSSNLLKQHWDLVYTNNPNWDLVYSKNPNSSYDLKLEYAEFVIEDVRNLTDNRKIGFKQTHQRLELLSSDLLDEELRDPPALQEGQGDG